MQILKRASEKCSLRLIMAGVIMMGLLVPMSCKSKEEPLVEIVPWEEAASPETTAVPLADTRLVTSEPDADGVEFLGIDFAADGAYLIISYKAPPEVATHFWQGSVYVIDEQTGQLYKDIPVMPKIGPLIGKPVTDGQMGYVMLVNYNSGVKPGSVVSVVIGQYKRVHKVVHPE